jgi:uncharacterized damage-inducible protein DinB
MASQEGTQFYRWIEEIGNRLIGTLDGMSSEEIDRKPPAGETSSLLILATHTMGNMEEGIIEILGGTPVGRVRDREFAVSGSTADNVREQWETLKSRIKDVIDNLDDAALDREYSHPRRGTITGRDVLILTVTHASEHVGHAEITRDWIRAER